jgi:hypothetical protein
MTIEEVITSVNSKRKYVLRSFTGRKELVEIPRELGKFCTNITQMKCVPLVAGFRCGYWIKIIFTLIS